MASVAQIASDGGVPSVLAAGKGRDGQADNISAGEGWQAARHSPRHCTGLPAFNNSECIQSARRLPPPGLSPHTLQ